MSKATDLLYQFGEIGVEGISDFDWMRVLGTAYRLGLITIVEDNDNPLYQALLDVTGTVEENRSKS